MIPPYLTRTNAQLVSVFFMILALILMLGTQFTILGTAMIGVSVWVMVSSESILLSKVQNEMHVALEEISRKKEQEVEQILYFLRQSSIAASPFESIDGAKSLCNRTITPAMVLTINHQIVTANKAMHETLGWTCGSLNGVHAHTINDPVMMSKIGEYASHPKNISAKFITSGYVYINKTGERILGVMHAAKIGVEGFLVLFYPAADFAFSTEDIKKDIKKAVLRIQ